MLYGMGDPLKQAVIEQGQRLRIYARLRVDPVWFTWSVDAPNPVNESFLR